MPRTRERIGGIGRFGDIGIRAGLAPQGNAFVCGHEARRFEFGRLRLYAPVHCLLPIALRR
jgi:hypothetical protein